MYKVRKVIELFVLWLVSVPIIILALFPLWSVILWMAYLMDDLKTLINTVNNTGEIKMFIFLNYLVMAMLIILGGLCGLSQKMFSPEALEATVEGGWDCAKLIGKLYFFYLPKKLFFIARTLAQWLYV